MFYIDNLRPIHDTEGPLAGDGLIQSVARECLLLLRRTDLVGRADKALYTAKETGKNKVSVWRV